LLLIGCSLILG